MVCTVDSLEDVGVVLDYSDGAAVPDGDMMWALRTGQKKDGEETASFCAIGEDSGLEGFLSLYKYYASGGEAPQITLVPRLRATIVPSIILRIQSRAKGYVTIFE